MEWGWGGVRAKCAKVRKRETRVSLFPLDGSVRGQFIVPDVNVRHADAEIFYEFI